MKMSWQSLADQIAAESDDDAAREANRKDLSERDARREPGLYWVLDGRDWTVQRWHRAGSSEWGWKSKWEGNWTHAGGLPGVSCHPSANLTAIYEERLIPPPAEAAHPIGPMPRWWKSARQQLIAVGVGP
jgi:hypothetical protein